MVLKACLGNGLTQVLRKSALTGTAGVPPAMSAQREPFSSAEVSKQLRACGAVRAGRPQSQQIIYA
jgi:hypothetical protein